MAAVGQPLLYPGGRHAAIRDHPAGGPARNLRPPLHLRALDRTTYAAQIRVNYTFKPDLNLDFYGEPFVASGRYDSLGELAAARTRELLPLSQNLLPAGDFQVRSFRSNLVLRWEWRPGSILYVVWQQNRARGRNHARASVDRRYVPIARRPRRQLLCREDERLAVALGETRDSIRKHPGRRRCLILRSTKPIDDRTRNRWRIRSWSSTCRLKSIACLPKPLGPLVRTRKHSSSTDDLRVVLIALAAEARMPGAQGRRSSLASRAVWSHQAQGFGEDVQPPFRWLAGARPGRPS